MPRVFELAVHLFTRASRPVNGLVRDTSTRTGSTQSINSARNRAFQLLHGDSHERKQTLSEFQACSCEGRQGAEKHPGRIAKP